MLPPADGFHRGCRSSRFSPWHNATSLPPAFARRCGGGLRLLSCHVQPGVPAAARGGTTQPPVRQDVCAGRPRRRAPLQRRSEEHTSELQSHHDLVCRLLLEKKKTTETPAVA